MKRFGEKGEHMRGDASKKDRGAFFTLVELLVVIAIIAVLAAMLLPALSGARKSVKRVVCASNMRNVYQGCVFYVNDYNAWLPPSSNYCEANHIYYINEYLGVKNGVSKAGSYPGYRLVISKTSSVYICPAIGKASDSLVWPSGQAMQAGYLSNYQPSYLGGSGSSDESSACWVISVDHDYYRRLEPMKDRCVLFGETGYAVSNGAGFNQGRLLRVGARNLLTDSYSPSWMHPSRSANFTFKDGHCAAYKYSNGGTNFDANFIPVK